MNRNKKNKIIKKIIIKIFLNFLKNSKNKYIIIRWKMMMN